MCEFLSWMKVEGKVLFLTDEDVFSSHGRVVLSKTDNDPIGHTAIKRFYNLTSGEQFEERNFWEPSKFPKEIAEKLKDFDKNFGRIFKECLQRDDLEYIVNNAPDEWKVKALPVLLEKYSGSLYMRGLTTLPAGVVFPKECDSLDLSGLTTLPAGVVFPEKMGGSLDLSGLTTLPAGVVFPEKMGGSLYLSGLTKCPKGVKLPKNTRGGW